jgi:hypothetical protein
MPNHKEDNVLNEIRFCLLVKPILKDCEKWLDKVSVSRASWWL